MKIIYIHMQVPFHCSCISNLNLFHLFAFLLKVYIQGKLCFFFPFFPCFSFTWETFFFLTLKKNFFFSLLADQGLNPYPLQWKCGILTTGPLRRSKTFFELSFIFFGSTSLLLPTHLPPSSCTCAQSCNTMDCSPPSSSVHGLFQARILE